MKVKQFRTGYEAKCYLLILKDYYSKKIDNQFESFETGGIEYGYILDEAAKEIGNDIDNVNFKDVLDHKVVYSQEQDVFLNSNNDKLKGGTIKFKLTDDTSELIDKITTTLSEQWNMRLYRAFSVKLMLKYLYIQKIEKDLL